MELLVQSKGDYLLEAPLEVLHEESIEWTEEINFWKDEVAFFYSLFIKTPKNTPLLETKEAKNIEQHMIYIAAEKLDDLKLEVQSHERFLNRIINNTKIDEQLYRSRHNAIKVKFLDFRIEYKNMKKKIFDLIKNNSPKHKPSKTK
ncbi:MAG TPA: hypothetical protein VII99_07795 [Bacteroidia bacterium]